LEQPASVGPALAAGRFMLRGAAKALNDFSYPTTGMQAVRMWAVACHAEHVPP
jgi:hypothetical protein